ncbi:DNA polymerase III subunit gamma/tau [Clostridium sp. KNHs214]|uniref:DNA polymerase III subunit gamma/tau n=1 Tax=Clostridium sp. KNHs214 TaxID=1540257 RepID=UPI000550796F|nr:DNA polymerase III subunit gamma/tau [Clostridium sp. KNHs214]
MAYTALYREWRPRTFEEVVGQHHVTITLRNQIKNNRIAHAYLLCGTRGTGKTSTAKIMAKAVNCLNPVDGQPCNQCDMCNKINAGIAIDVTELDAASHNGVDKIRDIIDDVQYPPQEAKYKVYIIDEVHMLSMGAVNAFLKTLEEPPSNVIFILATTDPQKLPITILSRCQRYDFRRIKSEDIFIRLKKIVDEQGVSAEDKSLSLVSRISDGAMRDALSILDQAISMGDGKVEYESLINMLGLVTNDNLFKLVDEIIDKKVEECIKIIDDIVFSGKEIHMFTRDLIKHMRNLIMVKVTENPEEVLDMSSENIQMLRVQSEKLRTEEIMRYIRILQEAEEQTKWSKQSRIYLEMAVIKMCKIQYDTSKEILLARINKLENIINHGNIKIVEEDSHDNVDNKVKRIEEKIKGRVKKEDKNVGESRSIYVEEINKDSSLTLEAVRKSWKDILEVFKAKRKMVIYASLMTGRVIACSGGIIQIKYDKEFAFNKKRLEKDDNRKIVDEIFSDVLQEKVKVIYVVDEQVKIKKTPEEILTENFPKEMIEIIDE